MSKKKDELINEVSSEVRGETYKPRYHVSYDHSDGTRNMGTKVSANSKEEAMSKVAKMKNVKKVNYAHISEENLLETVLNIQQRRKRAMNLRRMRSKIKMARQRAARRVAPIERLEYRAQMAARNIIRKRVAGKMGLEYASLPVAQKMIIDKKMETKKSLVARIAKRLLPKIRQKELMRFRNRGKSKDNVQSTISMSTT